jgi:AraC-like DNA-binding protein
MSQDFDIVLQRAVRVEAGREMIIPRHQHFSFELIYLEAGRYECIHNGRPMALRRGEWVLLRPGDWHTDCLSVKTVYLAVNFEPGDAAGLEYCASLGGIADTTLLRRKDTDGLAGRLIRGLIDESRLPDGFSEQLSRARMKELFWTLMRCLSAAPPKSSLSAPGDPRPRGKIRNFFLSNINSAPTLAEMAAALGVTPRTLDNHCRKIFKASPSKAFLAVKMDHAMSMLTRTDMSVKEISGHLGFKNPYHFSTVFRRFFKRPPKFFRRGLLKHEPQ